ncbi:MAG TPA: hypothetical protein VN622_05365 [Clostridia bacterium]|nr:hypothetical protein [Clostridia bacterium]
MNSFAIITNRKRAIIALVHSIVFLLFALRTMTTHAGTPAIFHVHGPGLIRAGMLVAVYVIVTSILLQLVRISTAAREKLYFAFCSTSAAFGLLRVVFGTEAIHAGQYVRVIMLICALVTGASILQAHSSAELMGD